MTSADDVARETSSATTRLVLGYVRDRAGDDAVARVLALADVPHSLAELEDPSRWVSYDSRCRLFAAVTEVLDDPQVMFDVGTTLVTSTINPSLMLLIRALGSAAQVYRQLPRAVSKFSTTSTMTVLEATATAATIRFQLHEGYTRRGWTATTPAASSARCRRSSGCRARTSCTTSARPRAAGLHLPRHLVAPAPLVPGPPRRRLRAGRPAPAAVRPAVGLGGPRRRATTSARCCSASPSGPPPAWSRRATCWPCTPTDGGPPLVHATGIPAAQVDRAGRAAARRRRPRPQRRRRRHRLLPAHARPAGRALRRRAAGPARRAPAARRPTRATPPPRWTCSPRSRTAGATVPGRPRCCPWRTAWRGDRRGRRGADRRARRCRRSSAAPTPACCSGSRGPASCAPRASVGLAADRQRVLQTAVLRALEVPELADLVTARSRRPSCRQGASPVLRGLLDALGVDQVIAVPLLSGDELLGVATASWGERRRPRRPRRRAGAAPVRRRRPGGHGAAGGPAREHRPPPGAARRAHRPAEPRAVRRAARAGAGLRGRTRRSCSATSTGSSR